MGSLVPVPINRLQEYAALVDRFYQANEHLIAPQQYRAAKVDFKYFLRLLELAIHYSETEGKTRHNLNDL